MRERLQRTGAVMMEYPSVQLRGITEPAVVELATRFPEAYAVVLLGRVKIDNGFEVAISGVSLQLSVVSVGEASSSNLITDY
jgi:hypothetical protein